MNVVYTVGHSNHEPDHFIGLLEMHAVTAVGDVRSSPYSRFNPQFNREPLRELLKDHHIAYVYLGDELGPRSEDPSCYVDGKVQYSRLARTEAFQRGLGRLRSGMESYRIALMCAEKDPIFCHRMILICRALRADPIRIEHILEDGRLESLRDSEMRLMLQLRMPQLRLFEKPEDLIERVYDTQADKIGHVRDEQDDQEQDADPEESWEE